MFKTSTYKKGLLGSQADADLRVRVGECTVQLVAARAFPAFILGFLFEHILDGTLPSLPAVLTTKPPEPEVGSTKH